MNTPNSNAGDSQATTVKDGSALDTFSELFEKQNAKSNPKRVGRIAMFTILLICLGSVGYMAFQMAWPAFSGEADLRKGTVIQNPHFAPSNPPSSDR